MNTQNPYMNAPTPYMNTQSPYMVQPAMQGYMNQQQLSQQPYSGQYMQQPMQGQVNGYTGNVNMMAPYPQSSPQSPPISKMPTVNDGMSTLPDNSTQKEAKTADVFDFNDDFFMQK